MDGWMMSVIHETARVPIGCIVHFIFQAYYFLFLYGLMLQMFLLLLSVEERGGAARSQVCRIIKKFFRASQVCIWRLLARNVTKMIMGSPFRHPQYDMLFNSILANSPLSILSLF